MNNPKRADMLADVYQQIEDLKLEAKAIEDEAKECGEDVKALKKIAKELITDGAKLAKKYESEAQLEMFRSDVKIYQRKGLAFSNSNQGTRHDVAAHASHLDG